MPGRQTLTDFGLALLLAFPASLIPDTSPRSPDVERASAAVEAGNVQLAHRRSATVPG
jgi:hypothetical protein